MTRTHTPWCKITADTNPFGIGLNRYDTLVHTDSKSVFENFTSYQFTFSKFRKSDIFKISTVSVKISTESVKISTVSIKILATDILTACLFPSHFFLVFYNILNFLKIFCGKKNFFHAAMDCETHHDAATYRFFRSTATTTTIFNDAYTPSPT